VYHKSKCNFGQRQNSLECVYIVMVLWRGSVVSSLYEAIYSSVSCARLRRELESLLVLYDCLLQIIIVEFPTLSCAKFGSLTVLLLRRHVSLE